MGKKYFPVVTLSLFIFLSSFSFPRHPQSLPSRIDALVNEYAARHRFMGSVLVAEQGRIILSKGYGLADVENNVPNTPETKFMIGSITKQFTAMLVTQLAEKGKLRFDDTISDFLPDFPKDIGEKITVEMLLCHTSGLRLPEDIEDYYCASQKEDYLREFVKQMSVRGLHFKPGTNYRYSNAGYHILGLIIEKATGKTYEEILQEQILKPLGMSHTGCNKKGLVLKDGAVSCHVLPDQVVTWSDRHSFDPGIIWFGSGFIYSTVGDLFKFSQALSSTRLLSKEYLDVFLKMRNPKSRFLIPFMPRELVKEFYGTFGNGFAGEISVLEDPVTKEKQTLYWHDGTMYLFKSSHYHYSGREQIIVILSNSSFLCENDEMTLKIYQLLNNRPLEHIHLRLPLLHYLEEDIETHAGVKAAIDEYKRLKNDTINFIMPDEEDFLRIGRQLVERGDLDGALLVFQCILSEMQESGKAYDALGDVYVLKGDKEKAIRSFSKSLELDPDNSHAQEMLKKLEK